MGIASWSSRVSVITSAVADRSGRRSLPAGSVSVTTTSKSIVGVCPAPAACEGGRMALLPISVTVPANGWSGKASSSTSALSPSAISGTSVSSTSSTTSITDRSDTVRIRLPALVHRPHDHGLALLHVQPCDPTGHGRADDRLGELVRRLLDGGLGLVHPVDGGVEQRTLHVQIDLRVLHVLTAHKERVARHERRHPIGLAFGPEQVGARLGHLRLRLAEAGLAAVERGLVPARVQSQKDLALRDLLAFVHKQLRDPRRDVGADVHLAPGADVAACGHGGDQVAPAHLFDSDLLAARAAAVHAQRDGQRDECDDACADQCLGLGLHGFYGILSGAPTTASRSATASW